jgi:hypothetical protein
MRIWNPTTAEYDQFGGASTVEELGQSLLADPTFVSSYIAGLMNDADAATARTTLGTRFSSWTSYTPTWTCDGTAPAIGNGSLTGGYLWEADKGMLSFYIAFQAGSTTTFGTNGWHFGTPPGFTITGSPAISGNCFDTAVAVRPASAIASGTQLSNMAAGTGYITSTAPWTWGSGDSCNFTGTVRATSP